MTKRGVRLGYRPIWKYKGKWDEKKKGWGKWSGVFSFVKSRKAKVYGGHPRGRTIAWWIRGKQVLIKIGKGRYRGKLYFKKRLIGTGFKNRKKPFW